VCSTPLLAFIHDEPGGGVVEGYLSGAAISAVNWSEVLQKLRARGADVRGVVSDVDALGMPIVAFDRVHAAAAAELWDSTRDKGLSLADRACLALARLTGVPAVTAERAWSDLQVGIEIRLIR
jgi:PIN domain nuclease of toxin-antitoxin system